jgi:hypothetical protein
MQNLKEALAKLEKRQRIALEWFAENAGTETSWPKPLRIEQEDILLASKAKGIYKPGWSSYALSVRQSLSSPYEDREPIIRQDGSWVYAYFQENADPSQRDHEYTNVGLMECMKDGVPVGVFRQIATKLASRYRILGVAIVTGWDAGYFFLEGFSSEGVARQRGPAGEIDFLTDKSPHASAINFDPSDTLDGRQRIVTEIVRRRGQPKFRKELLDAYDGKCAVSRCDAIEALEAAHILPYRGDHTNSVENGILLRADLHTLFDLGLIAIDARSFCVLTATVLENTVYAELSGVSLTLPDQAQCRPSIEALELHREWAGLNSK